MKSLLENAISARNNAHAPYSKFKVGASILTRSGREYSGANVENVAFPEGLCAEAAAIAAMVTAGETEILAIAVVADCSPLISPCGGCRQKIAEFSGPDTKVILGNMSGECRETTMGYLLPDGFSHTHFPAN